MTMHIGDRVVHPRHGLGNVMKVDERQFEPGVTRQYYEVSVSGSTVWVPLDLHSSGLRKLSAKREIAHCREILKSSAGPLGDNLRLWQSELSSRLKLGTIGAHCEVVRDLSAAHRRKRLSGAIAVFMQVTQDVLCQEWAMVEGITLSEAGHEIGFLLEKSRLSMSVSKA